MISCVEKGNVLGWNPSISISSSITISIGTATSIVVSIGTDSNIAVLTNSIVPTSYLYTINQNY